MLVPLLFLVFINDALNLISHGIAFPFADDKIVCPLKPNEVSTTL